MRRVVRAAAPEAEECISYGIPALKQAGVVVYFAAFKEHLGLFPPVRGDAALAKAVAPYAGPKGNLQFPYAEPLPLDLIERVTKARLQQNLAKAAAKKGTATAKKSTAKKTASGSAAAKKTATTARKSTKKTAPKPRGA